MRTRLEKKTTVKRRPSFSPFSSPKIKPATLTLTPQKADSLLDRMTHTKSMHASLALWRKYAHFLLDISHPPRPSAARGLLDRARQCVPAHQQRQLALAFAVLEYKARNGDPERGRTLFEMLFDVYPGHWDHWDVLVALEKGRGEVDEGFVRGLYRRMTAGEGRRMKGKRARRVFGEWEGWERELGKGGGGGGRKGLEMVRARREEYERREKERVREGE